MLFIWMALIFYSFYFSMFTTVTEHLSIGIIAGALMVMGLGPKTFKEMIDQSHLWIPLER